MILFRMSVDLMTVLQILRERPWALQSWFQHRWAESEAVGIRSHCTNRAKQNQGPLRSNCTAPALQRASVQPALAVALTDAGT